MSIFAVVHPEMQEREPVFILILKEISVHFSDLAFAKRYKRLVNEKGVVHVDLYLGVAPNDNKDWFDSTFLIFWGVFKIKKCTL